jgi:hypothetical protein
MSQQPIADMSEAEFDALIDSHIERTAAGASELSPNIFVDLLLERIAARTSATLTLNIDVTDDHLVIIPDRDSAEIVVQGNEVLIGGRRLILQLARRPRQTS